VTNITDAAPFPTCFLLYLCWALGWQSLPHHTLGSVSKKKKIKIQEKYQEKKNNKEKLKI
jgi:hypothetical protein